MWLLFTTNLYPVPSRIHWLRDVNFNTWLRCQSLKDLGHVQSNSNLLLNFDHWWAWFWWWDIKNWSILYCFLGSIWIMNGTINESVSIKPIQIVASYLHDTTFMIKDFIMGIILQLKKMGFYVHIRKCKNEIRSSFWMTLLKVQLKNKPTYSLPERNSMVVRWIYRQFPSISYQSHSKHTPPFHSHPQCKLYQLKWNKILVSISFDITLIKHWSWIESCQ